MRFRLRTLLLIFALGAAAGAAGLIALLPRGHIATTASTGLSPSEVALDKVLHEVWLEKVPLKQAARKVSDLAGLPIDIDEQSLTAANIRTDFPVTVRLRNATLALVLDQMAGQIQEETARSGTSHDVTWAVEQQHIRFTTHDMEKTIAVRTYEVSDLLHYSTPESEGWTCFDQHRGVRAEVPTLTYAQEDLSRLIQETCAVESWRETGGVLGSIHFIGGRMFVSQTLKNHRQIRHLLAQVRDTTPVPQTPANESPNLIRWQPEVQQWIADDSEAAEEALRKTKERFAADSMSLPAVTEQIARVWKLPFVASADVIKQMQGRTVSIVVRNATGFDVLETLVRICNEDAPAATQPTENHSVDWTIDQGMVRIVPVEWGMAREWGLVVTRVYDIRERVAPDAATENRKTREELIEDLVKVIQDSVDPESWREGGGRWGSLKELRGFLIITQTYQNHERIRKLLNVIRRAQSAATQPAGAR